MKVTPLIIASDDLLAQFLLPVPMTLYSAGLEVLFPKGGMFLSADTTMNTLRW